MDLFRLDKYDKYFVAFLLVIITIIQVCSVFAVEEWENVQVDEILGIWADEQHNFFYSTTQPNSGVSYFPLEKGYIYRIRVVQSMGGGRSVVGTSDIPALNTEYNFLTSNLKNVGDNYSIIGGGNYAFIAYSPSVGDSYIVVERQKVESMNTTVGDLVDNVGVNQLWSVFENGIDFVGVVVLVAFGLFLIFLLVKKISKGKADF